MKYVTPQIFLIAQTSIDYDGLQGMMDCIGCPDWRSDAQNDTELLAEACGRLCYKSFEPGLNANVTKVRTGNMEYIGNILEQRHGSVLEHAYVSFAILNVSRIETHEQVRHRVGTAYSQESGRYVRLDEFVMYRPDAIGEVLEETGNSHEEIALCYNALGELITKLETGFKKITEQIPWDKMNFHQKKRMTSALRRYAPQGQVTNIVVTANHRAWRHMIEMRASDGAEEEIALVFNSIAAKLHSRFPNIYQDMQANPGGNESISFKHSKV